MNRRNVTLTKYKFGEEVAPDYKDLSFSERASAIWHDMWQTNILVYAIRGRNLETEPLNRKAFTKRIVPWLSSSEDINTEDLED